MMGRNGMPDKRREGGRPACHLSLEIISQIEILLKWILYIVYIH